LPAFRVRPDNDSSTNYQNVGQFLTRFYVLGPVEPN